ncbi:MAG: DUF1016 N-terminal domain-containing protein [Pseudanabaena sp. Salubria-1]|nr:DUF1016 N-terminal domain-containing protein [Pseudanabaena sp. Salubria-1]
MSSNLQPDTIVFDEIKSLIEDSRQQIAINVNTTMTMLYWQIGKRINQEILKDQRAEYGKQIIATLAKQLTIEYGNQFAEKNLRRMVQFSQVFPDYEIVVSVIRQLSWTHLLAIIPIEDPLKRQFYGSSGFMGISTANSNQNPLGATVTALPCRQ